MRTDIFRNLRKLAICRPAAGLTAALALGMSIQTAAAQQPAVAQYPQTATTAVVAGPVTPVSYVQPAAPGDVNSRLQALEQTVEQQQVVNESLRDQLDSYRKAPVDAFDPTKPYKIGSNLNMPGVWNNGLEFRTPGKDFYFHVGGRTQWDNDWLTSPDQNKALEGISSGTDGLQDTTMFRRARLRMEGSMYDAIDWCVEYNFVNTNIVQNPTAAAPQVAVSSPTVGVGYASPGISQSDGLNNRTLQNQLLNSVSPVDLWWNVRNVPFLGNIQLGNMKECFGLERLESSRYLDFMERNFGNDAFISPSANGFAPGVMAWNWADNKRSTYALGVFHNVTNPYVYNVGDGEGEVCGRMTWLPYYDQANNGRNFVHLGLGWCDRAVDNGVIAYRTRGDIRNGPDALVSSWSATGNISAREQWIVNPELMIQRGPLFIQSEFVSNWSTNASTNPLPSGFGSTGAPGTVSTGSLYYWSAYVQALYFITGEHRIYDYQKALVGRVIPNETASLVRTRNGRLIGGKGAWQVGTRLNYINLNQNQSVASGFNGGELLGNTYCINWFLNPNMKIQWNYDITHRKAGNQGGSSLVGADGTQYLPGNESIILGAGVRVAADF